MNPERMLGSLIFGGLGRGLAGGSRAAIGMGLLGVAIAAIEHVSQQGQGRATPPPPPPPGGRPLPPPPPPASQGAASAPGAPRAGEAMLLLRAMIAAAYADGRMDDDERSAILDRAHRDGLPAAESEAVAAEMGRALPVAELAAQVSGPEQAEKVYAASLLAMRVDTDAEHAYLADLAARLGLSPEAVNRIHALLGA